MTKAQVLAIDALLLDTDQLYDLAPELVVQRGLDDFKDKRVTNLSHEDERLFAEVEDASSGDMMLLSLTSDPDGNPVVDCLCNDDNDDFCRHAIAALFAYATEHGKTADTHGAREEALAERRQRGRTEVKVSKVDGQPWFGTWQARSVSRETHFPRDYTVHIRSLTRPANYCNCPDFKVNQLGTCKHIEAVLGRIGKRRDFDRLARRAAPVPYVFVDWDVDEAPQIRLHRGAPLPADLQGELEQAFDAEGVFCGRLPEDFFRLSERLDGRDDIHLGTDAVEHVQYLGSRTRQRERASEIRAEIGRSGGRLPGVRTRLYPFQVEGVGFLAGNGRALLADDMGLGKTLQAIAATVWLQRNAQVERILVVCPASLKQQWAREIERFADLETHIVQGSPPARRQLYRQGSGVYIINYELVRRDFDDISALLSPDLLILDEAQRIKNWRTKTAAAVKRIDSRYAFVLTGTPLENRLEDLYSLMQVVDQQVLGPLWRYLADFHVTDERGKVQGYRNLSELRRRLAPVMLRRDRRLVRDQLPERIEQQLDIALTATQRDQHDSARASASRLAVIAQRRPLTPTEQNRMMAALQQARMACDAAELVDPETSGSPKLDELVPLLEELCIQGGLKAVVFSQWERMTALAEQRLTAAGLGCVSLHGRVPTHKRGALVEQFHENDAVQVFLSTDAGGTGLNLQCASVVVNLDVPWNPAVLEQRIARVHRLGQSARVQSILMVAADSFEARVLGLIHDKRELFDSVVDPQAEGDVVGVSRRLLETIKEDLADNAPEAVKENDTAADAESILEPTDAEDDESASPGPDTPIKPDDNVESALQRTIERIQTAFGRRIQRILGAGGGLLVVLDRLDPETDELARQRSDEVPVAAIDPLSLAGMARLGVSSSLNEISIPDASAETVEQPGARLAAQAQEKFRASGVLLEQDCPSAAIELLGSALLAAAGARAGLDTAPAANKATVWLYEEALPQGLLDNNQAALIMRALGLQQAAAVPAELIRSLFDDALSLVGEESPSEADQLLKL
jgi:superfamily II DNA or RNA helicase